MSVTAVPTTVLPPYANSQAHLLAGLAVLDWRVQWAIARARVTGLQPDDDFRRLYVRDDHPDTLVGATGTRETSTLSLPASPPPLRAAPP